MFIASTPQVKSWVVVTTLPLTNNSTDSCHLPGLKLVGFGTCILNLPLVSEITGSMSTRSLLGFLISLLIILVTATWACALLILNQLRADS